MKKISFFLVTLISATVLSQSAITYAYADTNDSIVQEQTTEFLEGLFPSTSNEFSRGPNKPTANKNIANGQYNMSGSYRGKYYLFSNYNCYGKNSYNYYFYNQGSGTLEIRMRNSANGAVLKTHFVKSREKVSSSLKMTDKNSKFYFEFYSTKDYVFEGYVK
ncbi:hypothetical protein [Enterococcus sp. AZ012]|uniref:hypothetical protein n=1 Tax=unclassified Enterococcus TaxID=2608891 RepID=UPI003D2DD1B3